MAICFAACDAVLKNNWVTLTWPSSSRIPPASRRRGVTCPRVGDEQCGYAFTVGLLQDYGVLALAMQNPIGRGMDCRPKDRSIGESMSSPFLDRVDE